ncbi:hypothetical protein NDU88_004172 [Pleurodeles waltl]|uniref:Uncharacterized protein n=1 Tax=Pleurodeles waltl TaxID=8319 RepID=A0AAV7UFC9_PLEWA|nr:hypothetical protein NDU88_004172 [Pleurodeles waltl]
MFEGPLTGASDAAIGEGPLFFPPFMPGGVARGRVEALVGDCWCLGKAYNFFQTASRRLGTFLTEGHMATASVWILGHASRWHLKSTSAPTASGSHHHTHGWQLFLAILRGHS